MSIYEKRRLIKKRDLSSSDKSKKPVRQTQIPKLLIVLKGYACNLLYSEYPILDRVAVYAHLFCRFQNAALLSQKYGKAFPKRRMIHTIIFLKNCKRRMLKFRGGKNLRHLFFYIWKRKCFTFVNTWFFRCLFNGK